MREVDAIFEGQSLFMIFENLEYLVSTITSIYTVRNSTFDRIF